MLYHYIKFLEVSYPRSHYSTFPNKYFSYHLQNSIDTVSYHQPSNVHIVGIFYRKSNSLNISTHTPVFKYSNYSNKIPSIFIISPDCTINTIPSNLTSRLSRGTFLLKYFKYSSCQRTVTSLLH